MIKKIKDFVKSEIEKNDGKSKFEINFTGLFIECGKFNFDDRLLVKICHELSKLGKHVQYINFSSFIWRHVIVVSDTPLQEEYYRFDLDKQIVFPEKVVNYKINGNETEKGALDHMNEIIEFYKEWNKK